MREHAERLIPTGIPDMSEDGIMSWFDNFAHIWRYLYAASQPHLGRVADAACGFGYGTDRLLRAGHDVCGFDVSSEAIARAVELYPDFRGRFAVLDLDDEAASFGGFDTLVSFETLEHISNPLAFLRRLTSVNTLICSVPVIPTVGMNPYHRHDFTVHTFGEMVDAAGFTIVETFLQSAPMRTNICAVVRAHRRVVA